MYFQNPFHVATTEANYPKAGGKEGVILKSKLSLNFPK
jgi:hypothetical protein